MMGRIGSIVFRNIFRNNIANKPILNLCQVRQLKHKDNVTPKPVFHSFIEPPSGITTLEEATKETLNVFDCEYTHKYPSLASAPKGEIYVVKGINEQDTKYVDFPSSSDILIVGGGLLGSALAYYLKLTISDGATVTVIDASPDSKRTSTAQASGSIRLQHLHFNHTRLAALTMALIRDLQHEILITKEEYNNLDLRPCSHLMLWPVSQIETAIRAHEMQHDTGCYVDLLHKEELVSKFPFISCNNDDFVLATIGQQGEGLVDVVALRNLYRTLGSAYGCHYFVGEVIDFNTQISRNNQKLHNLNCSAAVVRLPNGELRHIGFGVIILANGHNVGQLELKTEIDPEMRSKSFGNLLCIKPRVKLNYLFNSQDAPLMRMPVIVDVDGTTITRRGLGGNFHCVLGPKNQTILSSEPPSELNLKSMRPAKLVDDDERYNLEKTFETNLSKEYFKDKVIPILYNRVPAFKDAQLINAWVSIDDYNTYDGCSIFGYHPYYPNVLLACGLADKNTQLAPAIARLLADQALSLETLENYGQDKYRWNRISLDYKMEDLSY